MTKTASWVLKSELRFVLFQSASLPIHVAVIRRVRPGCESEFQEALRECFQASFGHNGVLGATMMVLPPGSGSPEFGILRTFADEKVRDDFYASPLFKAWEIVRTVGRWRSAPTRG